MKIKNGIKIKYQFKDARTTIFNSTGEVEFITKHCIWINNGKYRESISVNDIIAPGSAGTSVLFQNSEGKFVKGYIKNRINPHIKDLEI